MPPSSPSAQMERLFNQTGSSSHGNISNQPSVAIHSNEGQTSPLDLSSTSIRFPFSRRKTSSDDSTPSPMDSTEKISHIFSRQISIDCSYQQPIIVTPPKSEWHYRNKRDLAKGHIPFISGQGPQRTPIRIKISEKSNQQIYLGIAVVTHDRQFHDSKVIVPAKTKVSGNCPAHDNDLNCLQFNECSTTDRFDLATRNVYLQITDDEHKAQLKEVRVHMFNLYQNQYLTKEIIDAKQLQVCRLAFWFCLYDNKHYIPISKRSFSSIIREKKAGTQSNVLQQITTDNNINPVNTYSIASAEYDDQDYEDEDEDEDDDNHFSTFSVNE